MEPSPPPGEPDRLEVVRNDLASRFEGRVGTELVGVIDYVWDGTTMTITHTVTQPAWRGRGIAARLTRTALVDVRAHQHRVDPVCPYTSQFIADHPEFQDLLAR